MKGKLAKKVISLALCIMLIFTLMPTSAFGANPVSYLDAEGKTQTVTEYTEVTPETKSWSNGWYVVNGEIAINDTVKVSGTVHLILTDGAVLTVKYGIVVNSGNTLNIYAQSEEETTMGSLNVNGGNDAAAIGGAYKKQGGTVTINGGKITANGGYEAAGIGGGRKAKGGTVTINGGIVYAKGGNYAAGIGGGAVNNTRSADGGTVTITGGKVEALGSYCGIGKNSQIRISGGTVNVVRLNTWGGGRISVDGNTVITGGTLESTGFTSTPTNGTENGNQSLTCYMLKTDRDGVVTNIEGLPAYYQLTDVETVNNTIYLYLPSDTELGDTLYVDGLKCVLMEGVYTHVCEYENGFCKCGGYQPATQTAGEYDINGDGEKDVVYKIANAGQLYWFAGLVNGTLTDEKQNTSANAILTEDIVVNTGDVYGCNGVKADGWREWTPIGNWANKYSGCFDGNLHTISGLYCNTSNQYIGLFGVATKSIKNVAITNAYFAGDIDVGSIAGWGSFELTIENCYAQAMIKAKNYAGGILGKSTSMTSGRNVHIISCFFNGNLSAYNTKIGAILGWCKNGTVKNCVYNSDLCSLSTSSECKNIINSKGMTAEQLATGEAAWMLNGNSTEGVWKQTLGEAAVPCFSGKAVSYGYSCDTEEFIGYSNETEVYENEPHFNENGFCEICGAYETAQLNEAGYYEIYNAGQLYWFAGEINTYLENGDKVINAILMADIVINEALLDENGNLAAEADSLREWIPMADGTHNYFAGVFDGNHHSISGLYVNESNDGSDYYAGLFGGIKQGTVKNLGITDSYIEGDKTLGAIAGISYGTIENCYVINTTVKGISAVGGIAGAVYAYAGYEDICVIRDCFSMADVYVENEKVDSIDVTNYYENCYYLADGDDGNGGKTAEQFASGEVTYLLNGATSEGTLTWYQTLGEDAYPVFEGGIVYAGYDCGGSDAYYSNTELLGEEDRYHTPGEWVECEDGRHAQKCGKCDGYYIEEEDCHGGEATCTEAAVCVVCYNYYGDKDANNHESDETYYDYVEGETVHHIYHACCDGEVSTEAHVYDIWTFDNTHHWHSCVCGAADATKETHTFDGNGFCITCNGYEPAKIVSVETEFGMSYQCEIANAGQFFWYAKSYNKGTIDVDGDGAGDNVGAVLVADINLNPGYTFDENGGYEVDTTAENYSETLREWNPINGFQWVDFDGQGHTVSGLYINQPEAHKVGLFASNDYYNIKNIHLKNGYVRGDGYTAGIVGYNTGNIYNCHVDVTVVGSGLVGGVTAFSGGAIAECSNHGKVSIYATCSSTGGIVGTLYGSASVTDCWNTGHIEGGIKVGGVVGDDADIAVTNCYNTGLVLSSYRDGGEITSDGGSENCYYLANTEDGLGGKTKEQFASGEVAYLLDGNREKTLWGQHIGTDATPIVGGAKVYLGYVSCDEETGVVYTNDSTASGTKPEHSVVYTADEEENTITKHCENCDEVYGQATLHAPYVEDELVYTGEVIEAAMGNYFEEETPTVTYTGEGLVDGKPVNAGVYTATMTIGGASVSVDFEIAKKELQIVSATAVGREYDGTNVVQITSVTVSGVIAGDVVMVDVTNLTGTLSSADVGTYTSVTLPELTLTGEDAGNYAVIQSAEAVNLSESIIITAPDVVKQGWMQDEHGEWYYYTDGKVDTTVNGITPKDDEYWYAVNGKADFTITTVAPYGDAWWYVENGKVNFAYTGLAENANGWWYMENGVLNWNYTGLTLFNGIWFYVENGGLNWGYTGLVQHYDAWFYVENGMLNWNYTGLAQHYDAWFYVNGGQLDWSYTGLVQYYDAWFYVEGGQLNWGYTGLVQHYDAWFYVENGQLNWNYTGLVMYNGVWFYVEGGQLNWGYTGLTEYYGAWFYVEGGMLNWNYTGLVQHYDAWFYVNGGQLDWSYTGLCEYNGVWFYIQGGQLNWGYTGTVFYNGVWWYVENGIVVRAA